ncbi:MAG: hypothetical protein AABX66_03285 [Nanoarchaeota archaeon]
MNKLLKGLVFTGGLALGLVTLLSTNNPDFPKLDNKRGLLPKSTTLSFNSRQKDLNEIAVELKEKHSLGGFTSEREIRFIYADKNRLHETEVLATARYEGNEWKIKENPNTAYANWNPQGMQKLNSALANHSLPNNIWNEAYNRLNH